MKTNKNFKHLKIGVYFLSILILISTIYMFHPQFGKRPSGKRLERIKQSPQFREGKFKNTNHTPQITQNFSIALYEFFFKKSEESKPNHDIPSIELNWDKLINKDNCLIWFGHSSYFIRLNDKNILVDPVFSGSISPLPGSGKAFKGTEVTTAEALPNIDYLFLSHDHYDHMDYKTLKTLQPKVGKIIVGLGVGSHLEYWGYSTNQIIEKDWWDTIDLEGGFKVTVTPARHFSGRSIWSANTLWASYVLETPSLKLYLGGDSGYDTHFKEIGDKLGPFDIAILENGQYNLSWKHIHMMPEEVVQATKDLNAKILFPVHSSKFVLANHSWYEPLERVSNEAVKQNQSLITPLIGEIVDLKSMNSHSTYWWR